MIAAVQRLYSCDYVTEVMKKPVRQVIFPAGIGFLFSFLVIFIDSDGALFVYLFGSQFENFLFGLLARSKREKNSACSENNFFHLLNLFNV